MGVMDRSAARAVSASLRMWLEEGNADGIGCSGTVFVVWRGCGYPA